MKTKRLLSLLLALLMLVSLLAACGESPKEEPAAQEEAEAAQEPSAEETAPAEEAPADAPLEEGARGGAHAVVGARVRAGGERGLDVGAGDVAQEGAGAGGGEEAPAEGLEAAPAEGACLRVVEAPFLEDGGKARGGGVGAERGEVDAARAEQFPEGGAAGLGFAEAKLEVGDVGGGGRGGGRGSGTGDWERGKSRILKIYFIHN